MIVVKIGWIKNHKGPRIVCLYVAVKSLFTKDVIKSRYCQSSFKLSRKKLFFGVIIVVQFSFSALTINLSEPQNNVKFHNL